MKFCHTLLLICLNCLPLISIAQSDSLKHIPIVSDSLDISMDNLNNSIAIDSAFIANTVQSSVIQYAKEKGDEEIRKRAQKQTSKKISEELKVLDQFEKIDSATIANNVVKRADEKIDQSSNQKLGEVVNLKRVRNLQDSSGNISKDSLISKGKQKAGELAESSIKNTDEYKSIKEKLSDDKLMKSENGKISDMTTDDLKKQMKEKMINDGQNFLKENLSEITDLQTEMSDLKEKYSAVVDKNDLSEATKKGSLKGTPIKDRFVLGGNFNITNRAPFVLDIAPLIGFKINKKAQFGISGMFRQSFDDLQNGLPPMEPVYGYSLLGHYQFYRKFLAYLEGGETFKVNSNETNKRNGERNLLIGLGMEVKVIKWMSFQSIFSYNILYHYTDQLNNSPFVFKTGIRFN